MYARSVCQPISALLATCALLGSCVKEKPVAQSSPAADKLVIWQTESDQGAQAVLAQIEATMESRHPGLDVTIETVNWNSLSDKMTAAIQTGGLPDLAHVQPFMLTSLVNVHLLDPLDEVAAHIGFREGKTYPALLDAVVRNDHTYGIPYAVGTTFWAYRRDVFDTLKIAAPKTWDQVLSAVAKAHQAKPNLVVLLPGASPFFIDQLFAELAANNGGRLFDPQSGDPELNTAAIRDVIKFFIQLKNTGALDPHWATQKYQDQFVKFPEDVALLAPVTYARASVAVQDRAQELSKTLNRPVDSFAANQKVIAALDQPRGPSGPAASIATIDCEPFVLFKAAGRRNRRELAHEFLREFFSVQTYRTFVSQVPIHLTPILVDMRNDGAYSEFPIVRNWSDWQAHTNDYLDGRDGKSVRPILMPHAGDTRLSFLFEFQNEKILSSAVQRALTESAQSATAIEALSADIANDMQCQTIALLERINRRVSSTANAQCSKS